MGHTRIQAVVLTILFSAGAGVMAVQTSPQCHRFVRTYVTKPVRNRVSKATALAWAKWREEHPNWKPKPGAARPKYVMSKQEVLDKVAFACEAPTEQTPSNLFFTPADFGPPPAMVDLPPMETTMTPFPDLLPPEVIESPPLLVSLPNGPDGPDGPGIFIPPYIPPIFTGTQVVLPPVIEPTPEPASFVLVGSGMMGGWFLWMRRRVSVA